MSTEDIKLKVDKVLQRIKGESNVAIDLQKGFEDMTKAISNIRISSPVIPAPQVSVTVPDINVPEPKVTVNVPDFPKLPDFPKFPDEVDVKGWVGVMGYDKGLLSNPLPVQIRDASGKPVNLSQTAFMSGGGGGGIVTIGGALATVGVVTINPDGLPTYSTGGSSGTGFAILDSGGAQYSGSNPVPVTLISGSLTSVGAYQLNGDGTYRDTTPVSGTVTVSDITNSLKATLIDSSGIGYSGSNPVPVTFSSTSSTASALIDSSGVQYSGSNPLPVVFGASTTSAVNIVDSTGVAYESNNPFPVAIISGASATSASNIVDSTGVAYEGSNPFPITIVTNATATVNASITDSGGVQYSGSNPLPITLANSSTSSVNAIIVDSGGVGYNGSNPLPVTVTGSLSTSAAVLTRQTNPTAVAADYVPLSADDLGRQLMRPVQVRDLIATAYATFTTGTEATLLAGTAAKYYDLIYILASNNSTAAIGIDIRPSTAGSIVMHLEIPARGTVGVSTPVPIPQQATGDGTGGTWTVDLPDVTGTTVSVTGLFSQEI